MGFQHGKLLFTGWARGDIIENMLKDHRSADYNDSKRTDVRMPQDVLSYVYLHVVGLTIKVFLVS